MTPLNASCSEIFPVTCFPLITPTRQSHPAGSVLTASCSYTPLYWKFLADAHGTDTTNTTFVADSHWPVGGHDDWITGLRITESTGYPIVVGDLVGMINTPIHQDYRHLAAVRRKNRRMLWGCLRRTSFACSRPTLVHGFLCLVLGWDQWSVFAGGRASLQVCQHLVSTEPQVLCDCRGGWQSRVISATQFPGREPSGSLPGRRRCVQVLHRQ